MTLVGKYFSHPFNPTTSSSPSWTFEGHFELILLDALWSLIVKSQQNKTESVTSSGSRWGWGRPGEGRRVQAEPGGVRGEVQLPFPGAGPGVHQEVSQNHGGHHQEKGHLEEKEKGGRQSQEGRREGQTGLVTNNFLFSILRLILIVVVPSQTSPRRLALKLAFLWKESVEATEEKSYHRYDWLVFHWFF